MAQIQNTEAPHRSKIIGRAFIILAENISPSTCTCYKHNLCQLNHFTTKWKYQIKMSGLQLHDSNILSTICWNNIGFQSVKSENPDRKYGWILSLRRHGKTNYRVHSPSSACSEPSWAAATYSNRLSSRMHKQPHCEIQIGFKIVHTHYIIMLIIFVRTSSQWHSMISVPSPHPHPPLTHTKYYWPQKSTF